MPGYIETIVGRLPRVDTDWTWRDRLGLWKVRWNIGRMSYKVEPGLYAIGNPTNHSFVFASANYKLSFDHLRRALRGLDAWILVLDTRGVNVWCAAGKGTFGTEELIKRIKNTRLDDLVHHRRIIVPQLGAPGVAAHTVSQATGFTVVYGPVRAQDIMSFLQAGLQATPGMRTVYFPLKDRMAVIGVEMATGLGYLLLIMSLFILLSGIGHNGYSAAAVFTHGLINAGLAAAAFISGIALTPMLLPFIPIRAFAGKGALVGMVVMTALLCVVHARLSALEMIAWLVMGSVISSFLAMNFTGASTYTSLSGVVKEMRVAVPLQLAGITIGFIVWITTRFMAG